MNPEICVDCLAVYRFFPVSAVVDRSIELIKLFAPTDNPMVTTEELNGIKAS
jgi:hypothetical protein